jgi:hypothetical protein
VALSRLGAAKGGAARAKALTARQRSDIASRTGLARAKVLGARGRAEIAQRAAAARWSGRLPDIISALLWPNALDELRFPERNDVVLLHVLGFGTASRCDGFETVSVIEPSAHWARKGPGWGIAADRLSSWIAAGEIHGWWRNDPQSGTWTEASSADRRRLSRVGAETAEVVRAESAALGHPGHRYIIVSEILARGDEEARARIVAILDDSGLHAHRHDVHLLHINDLVFSGGHPPTQNEEG